MPNNINKNIPSGDEFYRHFKKQSEPVPNPSFDYDYEQKAIRYLNDGLLQLNVIDSTEMDVLKILF